MPPQSPYPTQPSNDYQVSQPAADSPAGQSPVAPPPPKAAASRKLLVVFAIAVVELLIILGLLLALGHRSTAVAKPVASSSVSSGAPQPATSTSLQQTNDSISQDLSSLANDRDFPARQLDDSSLGL